MIDVLFQDRWILVADKPAGMPSQRTAQGEDGLFELLQQQHAYVGLHHRLDRNASGLILFTLARSANAAIAAGFRDHTIARTYLAWLEGEAVSGTWSWPVTRKAATTHVEVRGQHDGLTEVVCTLETGRKHQIRVHAAMNGTPIAGDKKYGGDVARPSRRLALHASTLKLTHPNTGAVVTLESPAPALLT